LKERGEVMSKMEEANASMQADAAEVNGKLKKLSEKSEQSQLELSTVSGQLEAKEKLIREMEDEIWRLKSGENPGDALSTSTISRVNINK